MYTLSSMVVVGTTMKTPSKVVVAAMKVNEVDLLCNSFVPFAILQRSGTPHFHFGIK